MNRNRHGIRNAFRHLACFFLTLAALAGCSRVLLAQEVTGRVVGVVHDQSGAVIAGAHVVIKITATGISLDATSDTAGYYQVLSLPVGNYSVTAEWKGFASVTTSANTLDINQTLKIDVTLPVGSSTDTVTVEAQASPATQFQGLDTSAADIGSTFGRVTSAYDPPILQVAAHLLF